MFTTEKARAKMGRAYPRPATASGRRQRVKTSVTRKHDPEKWIPVFGKACPRARPGGSCSNNNVERDGDSKKSHLALRPVGIHREFITAAVRWIMAAKL